MSCFEKWDDAIHADPDQVKRRLNGEKISPQAVSVDADGRCALIAGSEPEPYRVTLTGCSCFDFAGRGLPCKHMYRLADELGLSDPWPKESRKEREAALDAAEKDLARWREIYLAGGVSAKKYAKIADALLSK